MRRTKLLYIIQRHIRPQFIQHGYVVQRPTYMACTHVRVRIMMRLLSSLQRLLQETVQIAQVQRRYRQAATIVLSDTVLVHHMTSSCLGGHAVGTNGCFVFKHGVHRQIAFQFHSHSSICSRLCRVNRGGTMALFRFDY